MGGMAAQERLPATGLEEERPHRREHQPTVAEQAETDTRRKRGREDYESSRSPERAKKREGHKEHKHKKSKEKHKKSKEHKHHKSKEHKSKESKHRSQR
jgi:hypothetical protein